MGRRCKSNVGPVTFTLLPAVGEIGALAQRYTDELKEAEERAEQRIIDVIAPAVCKRGHFTRDEFVALCLWKSRRPRKRYEAIPEGRIIEATALALSAKDEVLRIGILLTLDGISWPTASVLLHFGHRDDYPILDVRALESLAVKRPSQYTFKFWEAYFTKCRALAAEHQVTMRTLDRALWQWSKDRSPKTAGVRRRRRPRT